MKKEKSFDAVQMMREIRDRITQETQGMSFQEQTEYFEDHAAKVREEIWPRAPRAASKVEA